jgi:mannose/fructose-specific phosphotransferase system component IIA
MVSEALEERHAVMVTGVNLAMLIRACNYRDQSLEHVVQKAVEGGKRAVRIFQK